LQAPERRISIGGTVDVTDLLRRLLRRRIAVLVVLVLVLVAALAGYASAGSSRQSGAAVVIVPPPLGSAVSDQNPLLNLDNNLAQLATVLAAAMQSTAVGNALAGAGATASFSISTTTGTNPSFAQLSPQLTFTVTGSDATVTKRTAQLLVTEARSQLAALQKQANVPPDARATLVVAVPPVDAELVSGGRLRAAGSFGLAVLVLGLVVLLVVDEAISRRRTRARQVAIARRRRDRARARTIPAE
jgi:hypothetical protein